MKFNELGYYTSRHASFLIQYHLVLVTRLRHPVLTGELEETLINYTKEYFEKQDCPIIEINTNQDHIHILFEASPTTNLATFINAYKSASSRRMRTDFEEFLKPYYWKPYFWSMSYFIASVSERTLTAVKSYIQNQKD